MNRFTASRRRDEEYLTRKEFEQFFAEQEFTALLVSHLASTLSQAARKGEFA